MWFWVRVQIVEIIVAKNVIKWVWVVIVINDKWY